MKCVALTAKDVCEMVAVALVGSGSDAHFSKKLEWLAGDGRTFAWTAWETSGELVLRPQAEDGMGHLRHGGGWEAVVDSRRQPCRLRGCSGFDTCGGQRCWPISLRCRWSLLCPPSFEDEVLLHRNSPSIDRCELQCGPPIHLRRIYSTRPRARCSR